MRIRLLGSLAVSGVSLTERQRCLLAALLLEPGRAVPMSRLLAATWGDEPPSNPDKALRNQMHRLRRALEPVPELAIVTVGQTYLAEIDPDLVDLHHFRRLVAKARTLANPALLRSALDLWQDEALRDLPQRRWWAGVREALAFERRAVQEELDHSDDSPAAPERVPRQLPAAPGGFAGREPELRELADRSGVVLITAIDGTAGVGKTSLALQFAHSESDRFPDGHLYVNLRGFDPQDQPLRPADVLTQFLRALGVRAYQVPISENEQAELYRTLMAGRRMLVLLDNAADAAQVRPLLPGGASTCLITSRNRLSGVDASPLFLDVLSEDEAVAVVRGLLGQDVDVAAARELARLCGYLPLALRIAAANAGAFLSDTVAELREQNRLAALEIHDDEQVAVRAAFDLSYLALDEAHRRLFRRLGLLAGVDFTAESAAPLAGDASLDTLLAANLVEQHIPGRYRLHDLLRLYAHERAQSDEQAEDLDQALDRYHGWYLDAAHTAARQLTSEFRHLEEGTEITLPTSGRAWLEAERANLVALATNAPPQLRWLYADRLHGFLRLSRYAADLFTVSTAALDAAEAAGDDRGRLAALHALSSGYANSGRLRQAVEIAEQALDLAWPRARVRLLSALSNLWREIGDVGRSLEYCRAAVDLATELGQKDLLHALYAAFGAGCWLQGELETSAQYFELAIQRATELGLEDRAGVYLSSYGLTLRDLGRVDEAIDCSTRAIVVLRQHAGRALLSHALDDLAWACGDAGRYEEALRHGTEALEIAKEIDDPAAEADACSTLGAALRSLGRDDEAREHLTRAVALARSVGYAHAEAAALITMRTVADVQLGLTIARTSGFKLLERRALAVLAEIHPDREFYAREAAQSY
ncbi:ATP-binding protein [Lentzea rhizosphaerae]|uniref:ATP-binding protein n=1 Tax=Lentzea rhizosphaerae TaxID=2041025 RepID=A0ABV8BNJ7_9PSEU